MTTHVEHCPSDLPDRLHHGLRFEEDLLCTSLSLEDQRLLVSLSDINLRAHLTFGGQNATPLDTLTLRLQLHGSLDSLRRLDIFNFVAHAVDAPLLTRVVQRVLDCLVQSRPLLEGVVEGELSDLTAHGCLRQVREGQNRLVHRVRRFESVSDAEVKDSIDFDFDVVFGDCELLIDVEDLLLKRVVIRDRLNEGPLEVETGLEGATILAETLNDELVALRHQHEWEEGSRHLLIN